MRTFRSNFRFVKEIIETDLEEFNIQLAYCKSNLIELPASEVRLSDVKKQSLYYELIENIVCVKLLYYNRYDRYACHIFYLDGRKIEKENITGMRAFVQLQRMSNKGVLDLRNDLTIYNPYLGEFILPSIGGYNFKNMKYINNRYNNCFSYDINSSYSYAMIQNIPDTSKILRKNDFLKEGEIGFKIMLDTLTMRLSMFAVFNVNDYADYIFKSIESPFKKFVEFYYNKKKNAKSKVERAKYKDILNISVGYTRRVNPFIYSCILTRARKNIFKYIDDNTLIATTDSIVSLKKRSDLKISNEIGDFKIERKGTFAYNKSGYQWDEDLPIIRGKSKQWFKVNYPDGWDILKDPLPTIEHNIFKFDKDKYQIERSIKNED